MSKKIKKLRIATKLTQEKFAEKAGFHYKYYQRIESGVVNLTIDSIGKIAKTLRVSPQKLFT